MEEFRMKENSEPQQSLEYRENLVLEHN